MLVIILTLVCMILLWLYIDKEDTKTGYEDMEEY